MQHPTDNPKRTWRRFNAWLNPDRSKLGLLCAFIACVSLFTTQVEAQNSKCDPTKVMTANACAKCHGNEVQTWKKTPHFRTFDELGRRDEAKLICSKLGLRSVKRSDVCLDCHFTVQNVNGRNKPIAGVSCESCHGASKDWISIHNDYGGPLATRQSETPHHASQRLANATAHGMRNTRNLYAIASSCFNCHTVPNEELVNVGGHKAGTEEFELVSWSQGQVRHNFLRTGGQKNATSDPDRLRIMFVVGLIADLEHSTRATAKATERSTYGTKVANRAARTAVKLYELQQKIKDPNVQAALEAFAAAELKINNQSSLARIADRIQRSGERFSNEADGSRLAMVDSMLPSPDQYK